MPCVCLANTFRQWKIFKALKAESGKPTPANQPIAALQVPALRLTEDEPIRVPHARAKIRQNHALGGTPIVQDLASEIISMAPKPIKTPTSNPAKPAAKTPAKSSTASSSLKSIKAKLAKSASTPRATAPMTRSDLINAESKLGSAIFGPIPEGHRREFFHDQNNVWIWHEDWQDAKHGSRQMTVRYEVRTSGIYKKISAGKYFKLEGDELENFRKATHAYLFMIKKYLYNQQSAPKTA